MPVDEQTLLKLLLRERSKVIAYIWCIIRDSHGAEDIFQELCLTALRKKGEILGPAQVLPWLRSVARHKALKALQLRHRRPIALDEAAMRQLEEEWSKQDPLSSTDLGDALEQCVAKLNSRARRIIELRYGSRMPAQEVADGLSLKANSVYRALARIHAVLLKCVQEQIELERPGHG